MSILGTQEFPLLTLPLAARGYRRRRRVATLQTEHRIPATATTGPDTPPMALTASTTASRQAGSSLGLSAQVAVPGRTHHSGLGLTVQTAIPSNSLGRKATTAMARSCMTPGTRCTPPRWVPTTTTLSNHVQPGDHMTASVSRSGRSYTLTIKDSTEGWSRTIHKTGGYHNSSAEAVAEAPYAGGILPLANFHIAHSTSTAINGNSAISERAGAIDMLSRSGTSYLDTVSPINSAGAWTAFWDSAS